MKEAFCPDSSETLAAQYWFQRHPLSHCYHSLIQYYPLSDVLLIYSFKTQQADPVSHKHQREAQTQLTTLPGMQIMDTNSPNMQQYRVSVLTEAGEENSQSAEAARRRIQLISLIRAVILCRFLAQRYTHTHTLR